MPHPKDGKNQLDFHMQDSRPPKSSLVSGNWPGEKFFYHQPTRIVECVSEYIFSFEITNK